MHWSNSAARLTVLVALGVVSRLAPHPPNATALTTLARASRDHIGPWAAYMVPLGALLISDVLIGFYDWRLLAAVYVSFMLTSLYTLYVTSTTLSAVSSLTFFLITNGAVWALTPWYDQTLSGLFTAYAAGLPFLLSMFLGDVVYGRAYTWLIAVSMSGNGTWASPLSQRSISRVSFSDRTTLSSSMKFFRFPACMSLSKREILSPVPRSSSRASVAAVTSGSKT